MFESYEAVYVGNCIVKISKLDKQIQVFLYSQYTMECRIEWFFEEYDAIVWVEYMSQKYSQKYL
jgi:hypothetical protein